MDSRIALAANTQLHFQNKEGGAVRYTIIKEIGRGGSCIVYDATYETNTGDLKYVRIKECFIIAGGFFLLIPVAFLGLARALLNT